MTSQGRPYARLDRALAGGNPLIVRMAAVECERLSVADGLRIVLVHARADPDRYPRMAARWAAMLTRDRPITLAELDTIVGALLDLAEDADAGRRALEDLAIDLQLHDVAAAIRRQGGEKPRLGP